MYLIIFYKLNTFWFFVRRGHVAQYISTALTEGTQKYRNNKNNSLKTPKYSKTKEYIQTCILCKAGRRKKIIAVLVYIMSRF